MLRDKAVEILQYRLGHRTDMEAKIIAEMELVQSTILEGTGAFTPWFLESEMVNVDVPEGAERVLLPTDFIGEIEDQCLWRYEVSEEAPYHEMHKSSYSRLVLKHQTAGIPTEYAISADYFLLRPIPDGDYNIRMRYYARDVSLSTGNVENKWLKHAADLLIAETGAIMAGEYLQNPVLAEKFSNAAAIARDRLYKKHEARKHTNRIYSMGED